MLECIFISKTNRLLAASLLFTTTALMGTSAFAQPQIPPGTEAPQAGQPEAQPAIPSAQKKLEQPNLFEPSSPYLDYGDFNLSDEEESETLFYQYGRFFGVSVGAGYQSATGGRGKLYNAAFPRIDIKVHYWFDFQTALNFGVMIANHTYQTGGLDYKVNLTGFTCDFKYYFDIRNAGAALTFSNPFLIGGIGVISKTESTTTSSVDNDSTFSLGGGGGLEFPIVHKSSYFILEARYFTQSFRDSIEASRGDDQRGGGFYTLMGHILFTW